MCVCVRERERERMTIYWYVCKHIALQVTDVNILLYLGVFVACGVGVRKKRGH